jgi:sulfite exporter TauE/SafE
MDLALVFSCLLMGLAGAPHCAAMCGPSCAALTCTGAAPHVRTTSLAFHGARAASYAALGALASTGVGAISLAVKTAPVLRPFWVLMHCAALGLGLWMLLTARQPQWMTRIRLGRPAVAVAVAVAGAGAASWQPVQGPRRVWTAGTAGALWVAWPCGLLQSALVVAALCQTPAAGATAMGGFALASAPGLLAAPWLLNRFASPRGGIAAKRGVPDRAVRAAIRVAGALLAAGSLFALNHDLFARFLAYCGLG